MFIVQAPGVISRYHANGIQVYCEHRSSLAFATEPVIGTVSSLLRQPPKSGAAATGSTSPPASKEQVILHSSSKLSDLSDYSTCISCTLNAEPICRRIPSGPRVAVEALRAPVQQRLPPRAPCSANSSLRWVSGRYSMLSYTRSVIVVFALHFTNFLCPLTCS